MNRFLPFLFACLLAACASSAVAAQPQFKAGDQYQKIDPPVATNQASGIRVTEIFWYHCPHCFHFDPELSHWVSKQDNDVSFRRVPATFGKLWTLDGKIYYTEKALGVLDKMHTKVFNAIHEKHLHLTSETDYVQFFKKQGIAAGKFKSAFDSFGVHSRVERAGEYVRNLGVTSVPTLVVNGRYLITPRGAGSLDKMLRVADYLIARERKRLSPPETLSD